MTSCRGERCAGERGGDILGEEGGNTPLKVGECGLGEDDRGKNVLGECCRRVADELGEEGVWVFKLGEEARGDCSLVGEGALGDSFRCVGDDDWLDVN